MHTRPRSFTLVECIICTIVVSTMLVAALNVVGAARKGECQIAEKAQALALGKALVAEILQQAYADPDYGPAGFGIGADEITGNRSLFEDVDDYDGWLASPPQFKNGSVIPNCTGYEESVAVAWVDPNDLQTVAGSSTGVKRIEVTIKHLNQAIVTLTAYRTQAWPDPTTLQGGAP